MIVLVSDNAEVVTGICTLLKQKGDIFTVVSDEPQAFATIRADRATLLIVDTCSAGFNGFALCGAVKNDPDLAGLPVLCIISVDSLSSILSFLDCNGDGFLTPPFDLPALSSAIGDLQDRQAEGAQQGAVRTRFRINHDGREFSVVADRRQLLEYLLSAYESAVRLRNEQDRVRGECHAEMRAISGRLAALAAERDDTVANLHRGLEERTTALARLETALQAKEQSEELWKTRFENVASELKELGTVLEATRKSEEEKIRTIAALESDGAAAAIERKLNEQERTTRIEIISRQLAEAALERDSARSTVAALDVRIAEMERQLGAAGDELKQREQSIRSLTDEAGQSREKIRMLTGELDQNRNTVQSLTADLTQNREKVQVLTGELDQNRSKVRLLSADLEQDQEKVRTLAAELEKMARDKESETEKCGELEALLKKIHAEAHSREEEVRAALDDVTSNLHAIQGALEQNLRQLEQELALRKDLERDIENLGRERDALSRRAEAAEGSLSELQKTLATEKDSRVQVEEDRDAIRAEHERVRGMVDATLQDLRQLQEENRTLSAAKEREVAAAAEISALKDQIAMLTRDLAEERGAAEEERKARATLEAEGAALAGRHAEARKLLDSASQDLGVVKAALEEERGKRKAAEDRLYATEQDCREKDRRLTSLKEELETALSALPGAGPVQEQTVPEESPHEPPSSPPPSTVAGRGGPAERPLPSAEGSPDLPPAGSSGEKDSGSAIPQPSYQMTLPPVEPIIPLPATTPPAALTEKPPDLPAEQPFQGGTAEEGLNPPADAGRPAQPAPLRAPAGNVVISRDRWLDIIKWAHHTEALTPEDRRGLIADLMRLSKLVQKGRHLTNRQDEEIRIVVARVQSLGYRFL